MNKRQRKKREKTIIERLKFLNVHHISSGRRNGKTFLFNIMLKACYSKKYKPFKLLKRMYNKIFCSIDWSNDKDHSVMARYKIINGVINVISIEALD